MSRLRLGLLTPAFCLAFALAIGEQGWGADSVRTTKGTVSGRIVAMSPLKIDLDQSGDGKQAGAEGAPAKPPEEVPVNQVLEVFFENESDDLKSAKSQVLSGRFAEALATLERIKTDEISRDEIKQDLDFYKALCSSRLALAGMRPIADAGRMMKTFIDNNPKSYHYLEGAETLGNLLVGIRQFSQAAEYFARLDKAPWPDYKMRAGIANGRSLLAQGKNEDALKAFDVVLAIDAKDDSADAQRVLANLGRASVLATTQKSDEAIRVAEEIILNANTEDEQLQARAYNVLGTAYRQAGRPTEALLAFLHVDLLYPNVLDAHAEALGNLVELWGQKHRVERAQRAKKILEEQYKESPWAKKGGT
jgi:tetratricopeptide (TPR) repeat protein